jgi:hypothetical protein
MVSKLNSQRATPLLKPCEPLGKLNLLSLIWQLPPNLINLYFDNKMVYFQGFLDERPFQG